jgi:CBS domain-containing protein
MNPGKAIKNIMTRRLVTVTPDTESKTIQEIFDRHDFHHLPVIGKGEALVGIISKEDFLKVAYVLSLNTPGRVYSEKKYASLKAKDVMTNYPIFLDPEDSIGLAADIFLANKFHALPIVDDGILVGLVTTHDLLKYSYNSPRVKTEREILES